MSVQVKGSGTIGGLDEGLVVSGIVTSSTQINVGSNIKIGSAGVCTATSFVGSGANLTSLPAQATIANNADNRIITGGSGVNLNGEANLIYNGTGLGVGETSPANLLHVKVSDAGISPHPSAQIVLERSGTNYLQFLTAANGTSGLLFGDTNDIDVAKIVYDHNIPAMQFVTETVERLRIASNGRINIGSRTTTPDELVHIHTSSGEANVHVEAATNAILKLRSHSGDSTIQFSDASASGVGKINYDHGTDSLAFNTNSNERLRITSDGHLLLGTSTDYADVNSDDVQIYGTSDTGISITSGTSSYGSIYFGDGTSGDSRNEGILRYYHGDNSMAIWANRSEKLRIESGGNIRLISENGNNSDTPGIYFRGGSSSQKANFAKIHSRMVSNWGGQLQFKVKDDNGSLSDAYQTAMIMNHNGHVTKPNQPVFSAHTSVTRSAGDIVFDVTSCNVGGHYSTSNGRFTAPVAGTYYFSFYGMSPHNNTANQRVKIKVNGTNFSGGEHAGGVGYSGYTNNGYTHLTLSTALPLAVNDYVQIDWQYANLHDAHCKFTGFLVG